MKASFKVGAVVRGKHAGPKKKNCKILSYKGEGFYEIRHPLYGDLIMHEEDLILVKKKVAST